MDITSVKPRFPLDRDRLKRVGSEPKIVAGSHFSPRSGAAGINSPHQVASAGRREPGTWPKVRKTVVPVFGLTLTPVGLTLTFCALATPATVIQMAMAMSMRFIVTPSAVFRWMNSHRRAPQGTESGRGVDTFSVPCGALRWLTVFIHLKTGKINVQKVRFIPVLRVQTLLR